MAQTTPDEEESDEQSEYTVDVWYQGMESFRVTASSEEEAEEKAEQQAEDELINIDKILESRAI